MNAPLHAQITRAELIAAGVLRTRADRAQTRTAPILRLDDAARKTIARAVAQSSDQPMQSNKNQTFAALPWLSSAAAMPIDRTQVAQ
jgi:hypothetical protein